MAEPSAPSTERLGMRAGGCTEACYAEHTMTWPCYFAAWPANAPRWHVRRFDDWYVMSVWSYRFLTLIALGTGFVVGLTSAAMAVAR